jgi:hypothetical protein
MNTRLDEHTTTADPVVRGVVVVTLAITILGMLALIRAALGDGVDHVSVRIDNRAGLAVQVDALDAAGDRVGLGEAEPGAVTTFHEIPDIGPRWILVATYSDREVHRTTLPRSELAAGNWTITIPAGATTVLEQAGFQ